MPRRAPESRPPVTEEIDTGWETAQAEAKTVAERSAAGARVERAPRGAESRKQKEARLRQLEAETEKLREEVEGVPPLEELVERGKGAVEKRERLEEIAREAGEAVTPEARQQDLEIAVKQNEAKLLALSREWKTAKGAERERFRAQMEAIKKARDEARVELESLRQGVSVEAIRASREAEREVARERAGEKVRELAKDVRRTEEYRTLMEQLRDINAAKDRAALKTFIKDLEAEAQTGAQGMQEAAKALFEDVREEEFFTAGEKGVTVEEIRRAEAGEELSAEMGKIKEEAAKEVDDRVAELEAQRADLEKAIKDKKGQIDEAIITGKVGGFRRFIGRLMKGTLPAEMRARQAELADLQSDMRLVAEEMNYLEQYREEAVEERVETKISARGRAAMPAERLVRRVRRGGVASKEIIGGGGISGQPPR